MECPRSAKFCPQFCLQGAGEKIVDLEGRLLPTDLTSPIVVHATADSDTSWTFVLQGAGGEDCGPGGQAAGRVGDHGDAPDRAGAARGAQTLINKKTLGLATLSCLSAVCCYSSFAPTAAGPHAGLERSNVRWPSALRALEPCIDKQHMAAQQRPSVASHLKAAACRVQRRCRQQRCRQTAQSRRKPMHHEHMWR